MPAKVEHLEIEVIGCTTQVRELAALVKEQDKEITAIRKEVEQLLSELCQAKHILKDVTEELRSVIAQNN